jgi:hypothetical protein
MKFFVNSKGYSVLIFFFLKIFYFFVLFYSMTTPWRGIEQGTVRLLATPLLVTNNRLLVSMFSVILSRGYEIIVNFINLIRQTDSHSGATSECILVHIPLPHPRERKKKRLWQNHQHQHTAENIEKNEKKRKIKSRRTTITHSGGTSDSSWHEINYKTS